MPSIVRVPKYGKDRRRHPRSRYPAFRTAPVHWKCRLCDFATPPANDKAFIASYVREHLVKAHPAELAARHRSVAPLRDDPGNA